MKPPLFVRPLAERERAALREGLRSADAFTLRRCQALLQSEQGRRPAAIAAALGCTSQTVRGAINAFAAEGLACLRPKSKAPRTAHPAWPRGRRGPARPAAPVAAQPRQADQPVDALPGRRGLLREGLDAPAARRRGRPADFEAPGRRLAASQALAGQPRPRLRAKKIRDTLIEEAQRRPEWVLGFQDETWWTRLVLGLKRAGETVTHTIAGLRELAQAIRAFSRLFAP